MRAAAVMDRRRHMRWAAGGDREQGHAGPVAHERRIPREAMRAVECPKPRSQSILEPDRSYS
jgi:hypothetical protein